MKWPSSITLIRHGESQFNALKKKKDGDPVYENLTKAFASDHRSEGTKQAARAFKDKFALNVGDYETLLTEQGKEQARLTGEKLGALIPIPDIIFYSPYYRTAQTLQAIAEGWKKLGDVQQTADDRLREQEHGLSLLYNDWMAFCGFHPEQKELRDLLGRYWYQYPQGESMSQVRDRARAHTSMLIREYAGKNVRHWTANRIMKALGQADIYARHLG